MRTKIALLFFLFTVQFSFADNYLSDNTVWTEYGYFDGKLSSKTTTDLLGDTLIGGKNYYKVFHGQKYAGAIREFEKKIFFIDGLYDPLNLQEVLIYDFSNQAGDTIRNIYNGGLVQDLKVIKVDSITLENGARRKRIQLVNDVWIEGIGSENGLLNNLYPVPTCLCVPNYKLVCFKQKSVVIYSDPEFCLGNCCAFVGDVGIKKIKSDSDVEIKFDSQTRMLDINLQNVNEVIKSVSLIDANGITVSDRNLNDIGKTVIEAPLLKSGVYIVWVTTENDSYTKKILF